MISLSTHVLDAATGSPASGVRVELLGPDGAIGAGVTDADGRLKDWGADLEPCTTYRLRFVTAGLSEFFPEVVITFRVDPAEPDRHYHVPLLLAPFAYSTYRGS